MKKQRRRCPRNSPRVRPDKVRERLDILFDSLEPEYPYPIFEQIKAEIIQLMLTLKDAP